VQRRSPDHCLRKESVNPKYRLALTVSGLVLVLDQITKILVNKMMPLHHTIEIIPNFAALTYLRNTGAAFGVLAGERSFYRIGFFVVVSLVALGCILYLLKLTRYEKKLTLLSLSLILGGAVGNMVDRLRLGEVIDFILLHYHDLHWPAFNVADSAISVGVVLLIIQMIRQRSTDF
jgi:signal peptidase II